MKNKPINILHVVPSLNRAAGVARFVYNMFLYHDECRVHYDFLHHAISNGKYMHENRYDEELQAAGCAVYTVENAGISFQKFSQEVREIFKTKGSSYDIVHCHMPNAAFYILKEAKLVSIQNRILHSHLNSSSDKLSHRIRNLPLNFIGKYYATDYLACSKEAGHFLFGRKPFTVIKNGIPLESFKYNSCIRQHLRNELSIGVNDPVIGCVGRFTKQKNFAFAIDIFKKLKNNLPNAKLIIVGDGDNRLELEQQVIALGIQDSVMMTGVREDINKIYSVFDVFLMPSLYEGLPIAAVEAQAAGLVCIYSDKVPRETDITATGHFISLSANKSEWVKALIDGIEAVRLLNNCGTLEKEGFSARFNSEYLMRYYESLIEEK